MAGFQNLRYMWIFTTEDLNCPPVFYVCLHDAHKNNASWEVEFSSFLAFAHLIHGCSIFKNSTLWIAWCVLQTRSNSRPIACWLCSSVWICFQMLEAALRQLILPIMYKPCLARDNATQMRFLNAKYPMLFAALLRTSDSNMILLSSPWKLSTAVIRTFLRFGYFLRSCRRVRNKLDFKVTPNWN